MNASAQPAPPPAPSRGRRRSVISAVLVGLLAGQALYTFRYAEGLSYFSKDPAACANCHIMRAQYDSWQKSSHHGVATCVDCHLPHNFLGKYIAKALSDQLDAILKARAEGATDEQLQPSLDLQRQAQWYVDFIAAENSMGFHAPQEAARILGNAANLARQGQIAALQWAGGAPEE